MKLFISAAEPSSDLHAAYLIREIKNQLSEREELKIIGVGGLHLKAAGLEPIVEARELTTMGITEVISKVPRILKAMKQLEHAIQEFQPDLIVFLDFPDFHMRLARKVFKYHIPLIYFIPPKVWVWRSKRLQVIKRYFKHVICLFPFELPLYREAGISSFYFGNPLVDELPLEMSRSIARKELQINEEATVVTLMPGSRPKEIEKHFLLMLKTYVLFQKRHKKKCIGLIVLPEAVALNEIQAKLKLFLNEISNISAHELDIRIHQNASALCLKAADVAIIKSGTSTLEATLLECPYVVIYKVSLISEWFYRIFIRYQGPVSLGNIVAGVKQRAGAPFSECLGSNVSPEMLVSELEQFINAGPRLTVMRQTMLRVQNELCLNNKKESPSKNIASFLIQQKNLFRKQMHPLRNFRWDYFLLSYLWSFINAIRRKLYHLNWLQPKKLSARVISVGNIQAGGSGKTPVICFIARQALERGLNVCILMRGYQSQWEKTGGVIAPHRFAPAQRFKTKEVGDEALLIHENVPEAWIGVGADRIEVFNRVQQQCFERSDKKIDLILLDDGFQHLAVFQDLKIVLVTDLIPGTALFRDDFSTLNEADLVVSSKANVVSQSIKRVDVFFEMNLPVVSLPLRSAFLITGVGDPALTRMILEHQGVSVLKHFAFDDHSVFAVDKINAIIEEAQEKHCDVVVTGKDWVKLKELNFLKCDRTTVRQLSEEPLRGLWVIEPTLIFRTGEALWNQLLWEK